MSVLSFTSFSRFSFTFIWFLITLTSVLSVQDECKPSITGPGISPHKIILPARYFFISTVKYTHILWWKPTVLIFFFILIRCNISQSDVSVTIHGASEYGSCRAWIQVLDRHDDSFIVRYKMFSYCDNMEIHITIRGIHIAESPYKFRERVYAESCDCPQGNLDSMIKDYECPTSFPQIENDLKPFTKINVNKTLEEALQRFRHAGSYSFCHYVVSANKVSTSNSNLL